MIDLDFVCPGPLDIPFVDSGAPVDPWASIKVFLVDDPDAKEGVLRLSQRLFPKDHAEL
jgi:hypothetical protein